MDTVPDSRVLFGVDVVESATHPGYHLDAIPRVLNGLLSRTFTESGIQDRDIIDAETAGDAVLYTLPTHCLGKVVDAGQRLEASTLEHNRWSKPEVRLRIAVEQGSVADSGGYHHPKITRARLLESDVFKAVLSRSFGNHAEDPPCTGLIVSAAVFKQVFAGNYTALVHRGDFAEVHVSKKELHETAYIRVPGLDAERISEHAGEHRAKTHPPQAPGPAVHNHVTGNMRGVQAGNIHGNVNVGAVGNDD